MVLAFPKALGCPEEGRYLHKLGVLLGWQKVMGVDVGRQAVCYLSPERALPEKRDLGREINPGTKIWPLEEIRNLKCNTVPVKGVCPWLSPG